MNVIQTWLSSLHFLPKLEHEPFTKSDLNILIGNCQLSKQIQSISNHLNYILNIFHFLVSNKSLKSWYSQSPLSSWPTTPDIITASPSPAPDYDRWNYTTPIIMNHLDSHLPPPPRHTIKTIYLPSQSTQSDSFQSKEQVALIHCAQYTTY